MVLSATFLFTRRQANSRVKAFDNKNSSNKRPIGARALHDDCRGTAVHGRLCKSHTKVGSMANVVKVVQS